MNITFPHLGTTHLAARLLFHEMGIPYIMPETNSKKTLEKGASISPEEMCIPFKLMAGNLINAYENGADTVLMPATAGPCRLGEYAQLLNTVLSDAGMSYNWIILESPGKIGIKAVQGRLRTILAAGKVSKGKALFLLLRTVRLVKKMDDLRGEAGRKAGTAKNPGQCKKILQGCIGDLQKAMTLKEAFSIVAKWKGTLRRIPRKPHKVPIRVLLTGEIYSLIEPFASQHIEERLMELGVWVEKRITVSWWVRHTLKETITNLLHAGGQKKIGHLAYNIGGYARETVRHVESCQCKGYDGVIQIFPVGCMPEIVAKSVLNQLAEEDGVKILTLVFDEMDGDAGYATRVEAFIDMLERRLKCAI